MGSPGEIHAAEADRDRGVRCGVVSDFLDVRGCVFVYLQYGFVCCGGLSLYTMFSFDRHLQQLHAGCGGPGVISCGTPTCLMEAT